MMEAEVEKDRKLSLVVVKKKRRRGLF